MPVARSRRALTGQRLFLQRPREPAQPVSNLSRRPGREPEQQSRRKFRGDAEERERTDLHAEAGRGTLKEWKVLLRTEPGESVQTGVRDLELEAIAQ